MRVRINQGRNYAARFLPASWKNFDDSSIIDYMLVGPDFTGGGGYKKPRTRAGGPNGIAVIVDADVRDGSDGDGNIEHGLGVYRIATRVTVIGDGR